MTQFSAEEDSLQAERTQVQERLSKETLTDLLYLFRQQFPSGQTTFGPCPLCGKGARGSRACHTCLYDELLRRDVPEKTIEELKDLLVRRVEVDRTMEALTRSMIELSEKAAEALRRRTKPKKA